MSVFVDSSALYARLDDNDQNHSAAVTAFGELPRSEFVTHSYVVIETVALAQHRLGLRAVRELDEELLPLLTIHWVDERLHGLGMAALLAAGRRQLSLVDHVSFIVMREQGIDTAFAFDADFDQQGFTTVP